MSNGDKMAALRQPTPPRTELQLPPSRGFSNQLSSSSNRSSNRAALQVEFRIVSSLCLASRTFAYRVNQKPTSPRCLSESISTQLSKKLSYQQGCESLAAREQRIIGGRCSEAELCTSGRAISHASCRRIATAGFKSNSRRVRERRGDGEPDLKSKSRPDLRKLDWRDSLGSCHNGVLMYHSLQEEAKVEDARKAKEEKAQQEKGAALTVDDIVLLQQRKELKEFDVLLARSVYGTISIPGPPKDWSVGDTLQWLAQEGFARYASTFAENDKDGAILLLLTEDDLRDELGIQSLGDSERLSQAKQQ